MADFAKEALQLIYQAKYLALKRRCEEVQQANEKLVNRIYNVKKIIKRYKTERSALLQRLDNLGDDYEDALVPAFWEEGAGEDEADEEETSSAVAAIPGLKQEPADDDGESPTTMTSPSGSGAQIVVDNVKKARKLKAVSARKPASAYMIFGTMQRKAIQHQYLETHGEEASRAELTKVLSHEWKQLSLEEKQVYVNLAESRRKRAIATKSEAANDDLSLAISNQVNQLGVVMDMGEFVKTEIKSEND